MKQIAVVDLGTNAMRLAISRGDSSHYELLKYVRYPNRLSEGMFSDGMLKEPAMERTVDGLLEIHAILKTYKIDEVRLISTSVLRSAKNRSYFLELVKQRTGFHIEVISGSEEARLIHIGAVNGIDIKDKRGFVIDIGGGSTELSVGDTKNIELAIAIENGAVRLKEQFIYHDPPAERELEDIKASINDDFKEILDHIKGLKPDIQVGVPGNIGTIYRTLKPSNGLTLNELRIFYKRLSTMKVADIKNMTGLEEDKADILLPGLMILMKIMEATNMEQCYLSQKGLLHGVMIDLFRR
jgi:exopolyphosphatase/guanosine-5'-triphosphate,3'-diphosphate pyrophosphatase